MNLKQDENILVVPRKNLFINGDFQGLETANLQNFLTLITEHKQFLPRSTMETDLRYKQIIPYLIFRYDNKYFLMQRQAQSTEQRLQSKYSLGIGGHIREEDLVTNNIADWARREFEEEINYSGNYRVEPIGVLNDDSNDVGLFHVGFVFLLTGDSDKISVKSELQSGELLSLYECKKYYDFMETWSQLVFNKLVSV